MVEIASRLSDGALTYFHVHLVSDSTGETLTAVLKAAISQFRNVNAIEHIYALVRSDTQLDRALVEIEASPGLVMYTLAKPQLRRRLEVTCSQLQVPALSILDPTLKAFTDFLGLKQTQKSGAQHLLDADYFRRIEALDYTLAHDDGQLAWDLDTADVVLLGPSRTSKTPTCMYLANRGVRAANIPLVPGAKLPEALFEAKRPLIVGLYASPGRLLQIRKSRIENIGGPDETEYLAEDAVRREVLDAKRLYERNDWTMIDVSRRSVEETAATILTELSARKNTLAGALA